MNIGILGLGRYLPPIIRRNDHWPAAIVDAWRAHQARSLTRNAGSDDGDPRCGHAELLV